MPEAFKPVPVVSPADNPLGFALRCVLDLQLLTIARFLRTHLPQCNGRLLDVGAGEGPWKDLLPPGAEYTGVDVESADDFGMTRRPDIIYYDGMRLPFADAAFDNVLCIEVLEHVAGPAALLQDMHRVLAPGGTLIMTVPWSARVHHLPHDYFRYTSFGLTTLLTAAGFAIDTLEERGNDVAVIANKLVVVTMRLIKPAGLHTLWALPLGLVTGLASCVFVAAAHIALFFNLGAKEDPLGYALVARKS